MTDIAFRELANKLYNEPLPDSPNEAIKSLETQLASTCVIQNSQSYFIESLGGYEIGPHGDAVVGFVLRGNEPVTIKLKHAGRDIHQPPILLTPEDPFSFAFQNVYIIPLICMSFNMLSMEVSPPERATDVCTVYAYFRYDVRREMAQKYCYARLDDGRFVQFTSAYGIMEPVDTPTLAKVELLKNRLGPLAPIRDANK